MEEIWKAVPDWEGVYEVSNLGRVKSLERKINTNVNNIYRTVRERILRTQHLKDGYRIVALKLEGRRKTYTVHSLVASAFIGPRPEGLYVCHENGDPADNRLDNLRYDTPSSNTQDKWKHGRMLVGDQIGNAKLTKEKVAEIFALREAGHKQREIAEIFGTGTTLISNILSGKRWVHLGYDPLPFKSVRN